MKHLPPSEVYGYVGQRFTGIIAGLDAESALAVAEETLRRATELLHRARARAAAV
jgi:hypothetical protein